MKKIESKSSKSYNNNIVTEKENKLIKVTEGMIILPIHIPESIWYTLDWWLTLRGRSTGRLPSPSNFCYWISDYSNNHENRMPKKPTGGMQSTAKNSKWDCCSIALGQS